MSLVRSLLVALALTAAPALGHAQALQPKPSGADARIRVAPYDPDRVIALKGHLGYQTMIEFAPDERIENISIGDSLGWQVTPNRRATMVFLKPVEPDAATNMTVVTTLRRYNFELTAREASGPNDPQIVYTLRFAYPPPPAPPPAPPVAAKPPPPPPTLNFDYAYEGSRRLRPLRVYDDGKSTYFDFHEAMDAPAILMLGQTGREEMVNVQARGASMVVDAVARAFVLRYGEERLRIVNRAFVDPSARAAPKRER